MEQELGRLWIFPLNDKPSGGPGYRRISRPDHRSMVWTGSAQDQQRTPANVRTASLLHQGAPPSNAVWSVMALSVHSGALAYVLLR